MNLGKWITSIEDHFNQTLLEFSIQEDMTYPSQLVQYILTDSDYISLNKTIDSMETFKLYNELISEVARSFPALACILLSNTVNGVLPLTLFGTVDQKNTYLDQAVSGELMGALAHSEKAGSHFDFIEATAEKIDDGWLINGYKPTVSNAEVADYFIVTAKVDEEDFGLFIVERSQEGLTIEPPLEKEGMSTLYVNPIRLEHVEVSEDNLLGGQLKAKHQYNLIQQNMKVAIVSLALGLIHEVLDVGKKNLSVDRNLGRRLIETSEVRLAVALLESEYQLLCNWQHTILKGNKTNYTSAIAKLSAADLAERAADELIQMTGGYEFMKDNRLSLLYRDAQAIKLYAGSIESQAEIIAKNW